MRKNNVERQAKLTMLLRYAVVVLRYFNEYEVTLQKKYKYSRNFAQLMTCIHTLDKRYPELKILERCLNNDIWIYRLRKEQLRMLVMGAKYYQVKCPYCENAVGGIKLGRHHQRTSPECVEMYIMSTQK